EDLLSFCNKKFLRLVEFIKDNKETEIIVICNKRIVQRDINFQMKALSLNSSHVKICTQKEFLQFKFWKEGFYKYYNSSETREIREIISDSKNLEEIFDMLEPEESSKRIKTYFEPILDKKIDFKIILYDVNIEVLRLCEYLGNIRNITVDALMFKDSIEEERLLNSIRREKNYFEQLIDKRAKLPIVLDDNLEMFEDENSYEEEHNYSIVVDTRELRAELVFMLYKASNKLHISTLMIGDYLLSDEICIERKNIADLISSFNSGRLYSQALNLSHKYPNPYLLLEFKGRPCISDYCNIGAEGFRNSLVSKITIFVIHFPTIALIWSPNSLFSVKAIRILQKKTYNAVTEQTGDIDPTLLDILLSIPGITQFNIKKVLKGFNNLKNLISSSKLRIISVLGETNGEKVYNFFNQRIK
ncbi:DNA repair endonuclease XPF, partial [Nosema granulosis]